MMFAIIVVVLIATIGMKALEFASTSVQYVGHDHIRKQLDFYIRSSVEYAFLRLSEAQLPAGTARNSELSHFNIIFDGGYECNVSMQTLEEVAASVVTESHGAVRIDVVGRFTLTDPNIVKSYRTVQKP